MSNNRRRSLPPVPPKMDKQLRPLISAITEIVETGEGVRGDPMDRKLTYRDLVDNGIAKLRPGARPGNPGSLEPDNGLPPPNLAKPPKPSGVSATGGFDGRISLTWTIPGSLYSNHGMTRVYRAEADNLANASEVGKEAGSFFTDTVRSDTAPKTYFYWVRFVSDSGVEGPPSGSVSAAPLEDTGYIIDKITGEITRSELAQDLTSEIDQVQTDIASVESGLQDAEISISDITDSLQSIGSDISSITTDLESVESDLRGPESLDGTVASRIAKEREARIDALSVERNERIDAIDLEAQARADAVLAEAQAREQAIFEEEKARETEDRFLALQSSAVAAAKGASQATMQSLSQVQVSESEVFATQIDQITGRVGSNEAAISKEKTIRADETSSLATQVGVLSARLDARPSLASSFEPGADYGAWAATSGHTKAEVTGDVYAGTQAALIQSTDAQASPSAGVRRPVPTETATEFAGKKIQFSLYAKQPANSAAAEFAVAYTSPGYESGWISFAPGSQYQFHSFELDIPEGIDAAGHEIAIWGDTSGGGDGVLVDRVLATFAETEIPEVSAAIEDVQQSVADLDQSLSQEIATFETQFNDSLATVNSEITSLSEEQQSQASKLSSLTAKTDKNAADITTEQESRASADDALSQEVTALYAEVDETNAEIVDEAKVRADEDRVLGLVQNVISAHRNAASATFYSMREVNISDRKATATQVDGVQAEVDNAKGQIEDERTLRIEEDDALSQQISTVLAKADDNAAAIETEQTTRADKDSALASDISKLQTDVSGNAAAIQDEATTRADEDEALSQRINTVQASSVNIFRGSKAPDPSQVTINKNDLWVNTGNGNRLNQWNGVDWIEAKDEEIDAAFSAIQSEETARINEDEALASDISSLGTSVMDNAAAIQNEATTRADEDEAISKQVSTALAKAGDNAAAIEDESRVRASEDEVLGLTQKVISAHRNTSSATFYSMREVNVSDRESTATEIEGVRSEVDDAKAQIETEKTTRADEDSALSQQITTVQSQVDDNQASIQSEATTRANEDESLTSAINTVQSLANDNAAAIQTEQTTRADEDSALANSISTLQGEVDGNAAQIQTESQTRADEDAALAEQINTVQSQVDGNVTSIQEQAKAVDGLEAQYSVKVDTNGAVAGFGLASTPSDDTEDGSFSEFYVNADRIAVLPQGGSKSDAVSPFIVQDGKVYIDTAQIREGSIQKGQIGAIGFGQVVDDNNVPITTVDGRLKAQMIEADTLRVAEAATFYGDAKSSNYKAGSDGWIIQQSGFVEFNNAQIRGNVDLDSLTVNGELPEAGESLEAEPQSYSSSLGTSGDSTTLSFSDSATFDKVPGGASLNIDYVFDGEIQLSLGSPGNNYQSTHSTSDTSYGSLPLEEAGDTYKITYFDPYWTIKIPNNGYTETRNTRDAFGNIDGREGDFYRVNRLHSEFKGSGNIEFEVFVDGESVFSDSKSININESLQSSWSGSTTNYGSINRQRTNKSQRLRIPLQTLRYSYPEYRNRSTVQVVAKVSVSGMRYDGGKPSSSDRYLQMDLRSAGGSFNLSRL